MLLPGFSWTQRFGSWFACLSQDRGASSLLEIGMLKLVGCVQLLFDFLGAGGGC